MACNTIHFLDLFSFLTREKDFEVNIEKLDSVLLNSKRKDCYEISGNITIISNEGHEMTLFDDVKKNISFQESIFLDEKSI